MTSIEITTNNQLFVNNTHVGRITHGPVPFKGRVKFYNKQNKLTVFDGPAYNRSADQGKWTNEFTEFCAALVEIKK